MITSLIWEKRCYVWPRHLLLYNLIKFIHWKIPGKKKNKQTNKLCVFLLIFFDHRCSTVLRCLLQASNVNLFDSHTKAVPLSLCSLWSGCYLSSVSICLLCQIGERPMSCRWPLFFPATESTSKETRQRYFDSFSWHCSWLILVEGYQHEDLCRVSLLCVEMLLSSLLTTVSSVWS